MFLNTLEREPFILTIQNIYENYEYRVLLSGTIGWFNFLFSLKSTLHIYYDNYIVYYSLQKVSQPIC